MELLIIAVFFIMFFLSTTVIEKRLKILIEQNKEIINLINEKLKK